MYPDNSSPLYNLKPASPLSDVTKELQKLNTIQEHQTLELSRQAKQLQRQADIQKEIETHLKEEAAARTKDDKKYFWLGVLTSFLVSMLVAHSTTLIRLLQDLLQ